MKDFGAEVRASMDVDQFLQQAVLLLDVNETSLEGIVDRIVKKVSQSFACLLPLALSCFRCPFLSLIPCSFPLCPRDARLAIIANKCTAPSVLLLVRYYILYYNGILYGPAHFVSFDNKVTYELEADQWLQRSGVSFSSCLPARISFFRSHGDRH